MALASADTIVSRGNSASGADGPARRTEECGVPARHVERSCRRRQCPTLARRRMGFQLIVTPYSTSSPSVSLRYLNTHNPYHVRELYLRKIAVPFQKEHHARILKILGTCKASGVVAGSESAAEQNADCVCVCGVCGTVQGAKAPRSRKRRGRRRSRAAEGQCRR